jgi:hypothetical protein
MEVVNETLSFENLTQFDEWKLEEEKKSKSCFIKNSSVKKFNDTNHWYYYCNRSGIGRFRGKGERIMKVKGSCKIGITCIAHMKVIEDIATGHVVVDYCQTHNSHSMDLTHLPIPIETKHYIASKLRDGVAIEKLLDNVKEKLYNSTIGRNQLISRQDIQNIQRSLNIGTIRKHPNDLLSTLAWVESMKAMAYNSIIIFKQQGEEQSALMDNLSKDDFLLGIQTEFQRDAMKQFASKVILMDATHCVTQYDFLLISVFVIDDHGSGLPVAWAISTREDTTILVQFLKSIHERTGDLNVNCFMSDCADQYYAAWSSVFGQTKRLLCIWHVDKAWRKALNDHISSTQDRVEIYHQLRILLQETDKSQFTVKLQQLLSYSQNKYIDFYNYFVKNYVPSVEMWATCHRRGTIVNTNMFVEAFHRVLKIIHLNNKQNRRVDSLLHVLLRFARNLIFKQLEQVEKCKITHRKCEINKRHKAVAEMQRNVVLRNSKGISGWRMESFNDKGNFYILQLVQEECDCPLKCSTCNACIHMYTCTCLDATLHNTVCKHIHLLHMTLSKQDESLLIQDDEDDLDEWNYDEAEDYNYDDNGDGDSDDVTDDEECALDNDDSGDDGDHSASDVNDMTMSTNNAPNDELHEQNNGAPEFNTEEYFTHILNTGCSRQSRDTHEVTNEIETLTGQLLSLYSSKLSKCRYFKGCQNSPSVRNFSSPCH